ncbi:hypothetical protein KY289_008509 [Solanum tuberosum]|nr:hypothetical protein KY289_008509 [Solanum tuberosum]
MMILTLEPKLAKVALLPSHLQLQPIHVVRLAQSIAMVYTQYTVARHLSPPQRPLNLPSTTSVEEETGVVHHHVMGNIMTTTKE